MIVRSAAVANDGLQCTAVYSAAVWHWAAHVDGLLQHLEVLVCALHHRHSVDAYMRPTAYLSTERAPAYSYCGTTGCAPPAGGRVCLLCFERRSVTTRSTAAVTCSARNLSHTRTSRSHCSALSQEQPLRCERSSSRSARLREWAAAAAKFGGYCSDAVRTVAVCTFGTPSWPSHGCHTASAARLAWPLRRTMPAKQAHTLCHSNGPEPLQLVAAAARLAAGAAVEAIARRKGQYSFGIVGRALEQLFKLRNRFKPTADVHEKLTDDLTRQSRRCSR